MLLVKILCLDFNLLMFFWLGFLFLSFVYSFFFVPFPPTCLLLAIMQGFLSMPRRIGLKKMAFGIQLATAGCSRKVLAGQCLGVQVKAL